MAKGCKRCKLIRTQLTIAFGFLIIVNFIGRLIFNLNIEKPLDLLFVPSCAVIVLGLLNLILTKNKVK